MATTDDRRSAGGGIEDRSAPERVPSGAGCRSAAGASLALASALLAMAAATLSCSGEVEPERSSPAILEGSWQAELLLGEEILPFRLELSPGGAVAGRAEGAGATVVITDLELRARAWVLVLGEEGTELVGRLSPDAGKLEGFWRPRQGR